MHSVKIFLLTLVYELMPCEPPVPLIPIFVHEYRWAWILWCHSKCLETRLFTDRLFHSVTVLKTLVCHPVFLLSIFSHFWGRLIQRCSHSEPSSVLRNIKWTEGNSITSVFVYSPAARWRALFISLDDSPFFIHPSLIRLVPLGLWFIWAVVSVFFCPFCFWVARSDFHFISSHYYCYYLVYYLVSFSIPHIQTDENINDCGSNRRRTL